MAAAPLIGILLAYRVRQGKEHRQRLAERRGKAGAARPNGPLVWLHAASVGELASALPLIERICARGIRMLVTTGTVTSSDLAEQRLPKGAIHQFIPIDVPRFIRRFVDHWHPDLALLIESDLWPNLIVETSSRAIPIVLVNGRLSQKAFRRWRRLPNSIANLLKRIDLCLASTDPDATRLRELGAAEVVTTGNLKLDAPAPPANPDALSALQEAIRGRPVVAAASTHEGEETAILSAHKSLCQRFPALLTIIAPRHPIRGERIAAAAAAAGLNSTLRSGGALPAADTDVYIADTLGELGLLYRLAPAVFIGGSLVKHGGQNPIEAAKLGSAVLHGPHVWNFAEVYAALDKVHGAETVSDSGALVRHFGTLLMNPDACARIAKAGSAAVDNLGGALDRTLASLNPYLMQLQLHERARHA
ncbi:MAG TPA: 3-deoxy-D-manno-octulosonic acid transferase [Pseudolabrys sp.]|nr:3-deoxy-D-manno-octulosonic acid transferase [Pseudolabrys sp.]